MYKYFWFMSKINKILIPILIIHGEVDKIVPYKMGEKMYELANTPKNSYFVDENEHLVTYDESLMNRMDEFYETIINDE